MVAHERPGAATGGEAVVVVGFAVVNHDSDLLALAQAVIEVVGDVAAGVILKQLRIGPMHSAVCEESFGGFPRAAEAFAEKNRVGISLLNAGDDVLPGGGGDFVRRITPKAIDAAAAPGEEHGGEIVPEIDVVVFQF